MQVSWCRNVYFKSNYSYWLKISLYFFKLRLVVYEVWDDFNKFIVIYLIVYEDKISLEIC